MIVSPDLPDHPKTLKAARMLGVQPPAVVVLAIRIWGHCELRRTDVLGDAEDVAAICRWPGPARKLVPVLTACRWIDAEGEKYVAHGWREMNKGWLAKIEAGQQRAAASKRAANGRLSGGQAASQPPATSPASSQLAGQEHGRVEWSGVEKTPIVPLQGTVSAEGGSRNSERRGESDANALVSEAIHHLTALFGRKKKWVGAGARHALESLAMNGMLPLAEEDWAALATFYRQRGEHPQEKMWRNSPEAIAEELPGEIDKAKTWLTTQGIGFCVGKKEGAAPEKPEPPGWREWLGSKYPEAEPPRRFSELPVQVRGEFLTRKKDGEPLRDASERAA